MTLLIIGAHAMDAELMAGALASAATPPHRRTGLASSLRGRWPPPPPP